MYVYLVRDGFREEVDDRHAGDDERDAKHGGRVEFLPQREANEGNQHDAAARPDGVHHADRDAAEGERDEVEADGINGERSSGGQPFAEAVADFEQGGGDDFEDDSEGEGEPGVHVDSWFGSVLRTG